MTISLDEWERLEKMDDMVRVVTKENIAERTWDNPHNFDIRFEEIHLHLLLKSLRIMENIYKDLYSDRNNSDIYFEYDRYKDIRGYIENILYTRYNMKHGEDRL